MTLGAYNAKHVAVLLIIVRTWIRRRNAKRFLPDDVWIMVAGVSTVDQIYPVSPADILITGSRDTVLGLSSW